MVKMPLNVNKTLRRLQSEGFEVFCVGGCVRDSVLGLKPLDWDLATNAKLDELKRIFPEARVLSEKFSVLRLDFSSEGEDEPIIDIATYRSEGAYSDRRRPDEVSFVSSIEEDLKRRDFTVNAIADNPSTKTVDPYGGLDDIKEKMVRSVGDPRVRFSEDPLRILRAIRICAENDFDMSMQDAIAAKELSHLLKDVSVDRRREELERIITGKAAGKGLKMLADTGAINALISDEVVERLSGRERDDYNILSDNIGRTQQNTLRRLGLLYLCFNRGRAEKAVEYLNYDKESRQKLLDTATMMPKLYFMKTEQELKDFLLKYGPERYDYLHNLAKAQRLVYDHSEVKIMNRIYMMDQIRMRKDPIYIEDLALDGSDLKDAGIAEEKIGKILYMLAEYVHKKPQKNTYGDLMHLAKSYARNPLAAALRKVNWQK